MKKRAAGFSIVEAMLAVATFSIIVSGTIGALVYGGQGGGDSGSRVRANAIAAQGVSAVRSIAGHDWYTIQDSATGPHGLAVASNVWTLSGSSDATDGFTRTLTFTDICRNATNDLTTCNGTNRDTRTRQAEVVVTWTGQFGNTRTVSQVVQLTNWGTGIWKQTDWIGGDGQAIWSDEDAYDSETGDIDVSTAGEVTTQSVQQGCGIKTYPLTTAGDYTASSADAVLASGISYLASSGTAVDANTKGLWHLNDSAPPFQDASGNGNHLTSTGNGTSGSAGKFATGITADGANDYLSITDATQTGLDITGAITLEAWVKQSALATGTDIIMQKAGSTAADSSFQFYFISSGPSNTTLVFRVSNGSSFTAATTAAFPINTSAWRHVAAVYNGSSTITIYLDGVSVATAAFSGSISNTAADFRISSNSSAAFTGSIDEVRVSDVARYSGNFTPATTPFGLNYPTTQPNVKPNTDYDPAAVGRWQAFSESATKERNGEVYYQLSDDSGATWKWWNGSSWATVNSATDYNTATTINTNLPTFSTTAGKLNWRAFLVSNGSDQVTLDSVTLTCVMLQQWDYSTSGDYTTDSGITISGGSAALTSSGSDVDANTIALYHMNETVSAAPLLDYTANTNDLTPDGTSAVTWNSLGKFITGIRFGSVASTFELGGAEAVGMSPADSFTIDFWLYKNGWSAADDIFQKWSTTNATRSYKVTTTSAGVIAFSTGNGTTTTTLNSTAALPLDQWAHAAVVFEQTTPTTGQMRIYINGVAAGSVNTTYGAVLNNPAVDVRLSGIGAASLQGYVDELRFSNNVRYSANFTPESAVYGKTYSTAIPTIRNTSAFTATNPTAWYGFASTQTTFNESSVNYQISNDGSTWKYWNGSAWATVSGATDYNSAATINTNIVSFSLAPDNTFYFKAFLKSTGSDPVSVDLTEVMYVQDPDTGGSGGGGGGSATLTSSAFDLERETSVTRVEWDEDDTPCAADCTVRLQVRTAPDNGGAPGTWTAWYGASGAGTYFTDGDYSTPEDALQGNRWVQYKLDLDGTGGGTPVVEEVRLYYDE